ncbi:hypothetical protein VPBB_0085 [Vibrio parahaemolyticus BB22OP]|nr:hypothetical protein VPBB_0085 [Vibrio parahaemolyticus BB22OP]
MHESVRGKFEGLLIQQALLQSRFTLDAFYLHGSVEFG